MCWFLFYDAIIHYVLIFFVSFYSYSKQCPETSVRTTKLQYHIPERKTTTYHCRGIGKFSVLESVTTYNNFWNIGTCNIREPLNADKKYINRTFIITNWFSVSSIRTEHQTYTDDVRSSITSI